MNSETIVLRILYYIFAQTDTILVPHRTVVKCLFPHTNLIKQYKYTHVQLITLSTLIDGNQYVLNLFTQFMKI